MAGLTLRDKTKERIFRYLGHILRGSAGRELKDIIEIEITQKGKVRGRKRMMWHEIGKSVTGIKEEKVYLPFTLMQEIYEIDNAESESANRFHLYCMVL